MEIQVYKYEIILLYFKLKIILNIDI